MRPDEVASCGVNIGSGTLAQMLHLVVVDDFEAMPARATGCAELPVVAASAELEVVNSLTGIAGGEGEGTFPALLPVIESHIALALDYSRALARCWLHAVAVRPDELAIGHHLDREAGELVADQPPVAIFVEAELVVLSVVVAHFASFSAEDSVISSPPFRIICFIAAHFHVIQAVEVVTASIVLKIGEAGLLEARAVATM